MKKKNLLISALLVCFLSSCGGTSETPTPQPSENDPTTDVSESTSTPVSELVSQNQFAQELAFLTDSFVISNINDTFNVNETKKYYKLIADHDDEYAFKGIFDGNGHCISNINIYYFALFFSLSRTMDSTGTTYSLIHINI